MSGWRPCVACWQEPWSRRRSNRPVNWVNNKRVRDAARCARSSMKSDRSRCGAAVPSNTMNRRHIARPAAGIFFPQRPLLKLDTHAYSPSVLKKIVEAAGEVKSHEKAAKVLRGVGEISISGRHVNRLTEEIGTELKEKRDRET